MGFTGNCCNDNNIIHTKSMKNRIYYTLIIIGLILFLGQLTKHFDFIFPLIILLFLANSGLRRKIANLLKTKIKKRDINSKNTTNNNNNNNINNMNDIKNAITDKINSTKKIVFLVAIGIFLIILLFNSVIVIKAGQTGVFSLIAYTFSV